MDSKGEHHLQKGLLTTAGFTLLAGLLMNMALPVPDGHAAYPAEERLHVLFIGPAHGYDGRAAAECTLLESLTDVRFSVLPVPHDSGDHIADIDGHFGKDPRWIAVRKGAILQHLQRDYDAVMIAAGIADADIQNALAKRLLDGGILIWMAGDKAPVWLADALEGKEPPPAPDINPLAGLGLEQAGIKPGRVKLLAGGLTALNVNAGAKRPITLAAFASVGRGRIMSLPALFPVSFTADVDGDWLWARAFERLVRFAVEGAVTPAIAVEAAVADPVAQPSLEQKYAVTLSGPKGINLRLLQSDMHGAVRELAKGVKLTGEPVTVDVLLEVNPSGPLMLEAVPTAGPAVPGMTFVRLPSLLELDLYVTQQGYTPDFDTQSTLDLDPKADIGKAILHWTVLDWARKAIVYRAEPIELTAGQPIEKTFKHTLSDPDSRAYVNWLEATVTDAKGRVLARGETRLYRYRPYDMTEQLLIATWHTDQISERPGFNALLARYLRESGFNAVFNFADQDVSERHNFRRYMEHQATTRIGVAHNVAPFKGEIDGYAERYQAQGRIRGGAGKGFGEPGYRGPWPSAAVNMFSMGEETGFGRWSEAYPWRGQEAAPEEANKWLRYYLQQLYGNDLANLNVAWGKNFKDWSEIKIRRKYAEPFGWMFVPPPKGLEENLTPYVDTHAFHEWYVEEFCRNYMKGYVTANPVTTWSMSYDFTFIQFPPAPMTHFWAALAPEGVALWHTYVRSRTPGSANPFHLNWMFFEDEPMNNQFLQLGFASGCTYMSTWGHVFNGDLTPTRSSLAVAKTMAQVERPAAILRKMQPHHDPRVGIYTLDSRWTLVRGRYGFFLDRNGPNDVSLGKAGYQAPGASYVKPPEIDLYQALTASGYAPKFVRPDELSECKVLFLPYVEAIAPETADKVRTFVENGGTLVVFPTIAKYDEGGKPYETYPGAGFDELLGFTADPNWRMGRSQVEFPGENAAKKAFAEAWFLGDREADAKEEAQELEPPLYFKMAMRIGGHPSHYMPEGHQQLTGLGKDVAVIGRHQDGNPLLTYRRVGKGAAICFNVLLTADSALELAKTAQTETFRQVIDQLVRRSGVTPDVEFENLRSYGEGINDFAVMQYDLPGTTTRILTFFTDYRGRTAHARLRLRPPFEAAYDVLAGRQLVTVMNPAEQAPETVVVVEPGYWRVIALSPDAVPQPTVAGPASARLGETVAFNVGPDTGATRYGRLEVRGPDGDLLAHHSGSVVLTAEQQLELRLRLDDRVEDANGKVKPWIVRYIDATSGQGAETQLRVRPSKDATALAKATLPGDSLSLSRQLMARGPEISDAEFIGLLQQLRERHLDTRPVDKRIYSYYSYEMGGSRHHLTQLLATVDWTTRVDALVAFLRGGERLYLVCEDLGFDAESGVTTTPGRRPRILAALRQLAARKDAEVMAVSGKPYLRVIKVGNGMLVLDRRSPDGSGNSNLHLAAFQKAWCEEMSTCGLARGGSGARLGPVGDESLAEWFFRDRYEEMRVEVHRRW